jgi:hypothetical protein
MRFRAELQQELRAAARDKRKGRERRAELEARGVKEAREYAAARRAALGAMAAAYDALAAASAALQPRLSARAVAALLRLLNAPDAQPHARETALLALALLAPLADAAAVDAAVAALAHASPSTARAGVLCVGALGGDHAVAALVAIVRRSGARAPRSAASHAGASPGCAGAGAGVGPVVAETPAEQRARKLTTVGALEALAWVLRDPRMAARHHRAAVVAFRAAGSAAGDVRIAAARAAVLLGRGERAGAARARETFEADRRPPFAPSNCVEYAPADPEELRRAVWRDPARRGAAPFDEPAAAPEPPTRNMGNRHALPAPSRSLRDYGISSINPSRVVQQPSAVSSASHGRAEPPWGFAALGADENDARVWAEERERAAREKKARQEERERARREEQARRGPGLTHLRSLLCAHSRSHAPHLAHSHSLTHSLARSLARAHTLFLHTRTNTPSAPDAEARGAGAGA